MRKVGWVDVGVYRGHAGLSHRPARRRGVVAREADARGTAAAEVEREYLEGQSIARFVQPGEIADLCLFLGSDAARMISGQAIAVDGHTETFHIG